ncbi:MAG: 50S ribosomal protein L29 [Chitinophagales bacterium]
MAKKKLDLRELSTEELWDRIEEDKAQLRKLRFNHTVAALDNPNVLRNLRRDVARYNTELRRRELEDSRASK